jgi:glutaredoxin
MMVLKIAVRDQLLAYTGEVTMRAKATFYHAGCPVCVAAEKNIALSLDPAKYDVEIVHLGNERGRVNEAESAGVKSVPALVMDGHVFHINHGADLTVLKG